MTRRWKIAGVSAAGILFIALTALCRPAPWLVWNASESVPIGLYAVRPVARLEVAELVVAYPPEPLASFLAEGDYLPDGLPLLKHVAALSGQTVCRKGAAVSVDGIVLALAQKHDHAGRRLPIWRGCRSLGPDDVFLLNSGQPASLDGRYFGPLPKRSIVGRATPVWTKGSH